MGSGRLGFPQVVLVTCQATLTMAGHDADRLGSGRTMQLTNITAWAGFLLPGRVHAVGQIPIVKDSKSGP